MLRFAKVFTVLAAAAVLAGPARADDRAKAAPVVDIVLCLDVSIELDTSRHRTMSTTGAALALSSARAGPASTAAAARTVNTFAKRSMGLLQQSAPAACGVALRRKRRGQGHFS